MNCREKIAKAIRIVSIPPAMALLFLAVVYVGRGGIFRGRLDFIISVILLVLFPILAYPFQQLVPCYQRSGREGQRKLAFLFSLIGYLVLLVYGIATRVSREMMKICLTYFITVLLLTICNKVLKIKASGHAASCTSPLIFFVYFLHWYLIFPCGILFLVILWSSVVLKRHTVTEFLTGTGICMISFAISLAAINLLY